MRYGIICMLVLLCGTIRGEDVSLKFTPATWNKDKVALHMGAGYYKDLFMSNDYGAFIMANTPVLEIKSNISLDVGVFVPISKFVSVRPNFSINYMIDRFQIGLLTGVSSYGITIEYVTWYF